MRPEHLFYALIALWAGSEFLLIGRKRAGKGDRRQDRGTLRLLTLTIYGSIAAAVVLGRAQVWPFPPEWRLPLFWFGLALMAAGLLFRGWAVRVLAQFFTVDVSIRQGHRLVNDGPYRWLRHPSYTGSLATFYGFGLAWGGWASLLAVAVPVTLVFLRRIRVEEQVLSEAFPVDYPRYAATTKRLLPFLW